MEGFLFRRVSYENIPGGACYEYRGYCVERKGEKVYPIILYFKGDEIVICYMGGNEIKPVFSLYVAPGELNQAMLSEKVEYYWKMGVWEPPGKDEGEKESEEELIVDEVTLLLSPFPALYGFRVGDGFFEEDRLFKRERRPDDVRVERERILFYHSSQVWRRIKHEGEGLERMGKVRGQSVYDPRLLDEWRWEGGSIKTTRVNFRRILVDFLFELDQARTFEDKNFLRVQSAIQDNKVLDALSRKISYLSELRKSQEVEIWRRPPKPFLKAERMWLNVCFLEKYSSVFSSPESIFKGVEEEVKDVIFRACVGKRELPRRRYFMREDRDIRNHSATFFLRRYAISDAFKVLLPSWFSPWLVLPILLSIPFGDFLIYALAHGNGSPSFHSCGIFSVGVPLALIFIAVVYYMVKGVNLFKLSLPRLFLGITIGWLAFATAEELWKRALLAKGTMTLVVDCVFGGLIFLYLFTEIRNRLVRLGSWDILKRTSIVVVLAGAMSLVQGFYIIQLFARPMLENSGIVDEIASGREHYRIDVLENLKRGRSRVGEEVGKGKKGKYTYKDKFSKSLGRYYLPLRLLGNENWHIRYIWSILFSQFILTIFIGVVLQFLWEDRPITEPL